MASVTLSSKYQIAIPKALRVELGLEAGQEFVVIPKGTVLELVPVRSIEAARGMLKGASPANYRDRTERV
jgi:AbrB family looped-hinge helix DNA binding protein